MMGLKLRKTQKASLFFVFVILILGCSASQIIESDSIAVFKSIAISPDGRYIAAGRSVFNIIFLYDAKTLEIVKYFRGRKKDTWGNFYARSLEFSPDGNYLAAAGIDDTVCIWNVSTGEELLFLTEFQKPNSISFSPEGTILAVTGIDDTIRLVDIHTGEIIAILRGNNKASLSVAFSPSKKFLATGGSDNVVRLWDLETKKQIATYEGHTAPIERITFSPDGNKMITTSKAELKRWQIESKTDSEDLFDTEGFRAELSGLTLLVNLLGVVNFVQTGPGPAATSTFASVSLQSPLSADFSADGRYLALTIPKFTLGGDYQMRIYNLETNNIVSANGQFFAIAIAPDGEYAATAGSGVKLWDLESGEQIKRKRGK
jgi:WD40 repeat protein